MDKYLDTIIKRFINSRAKFLKIDLGWRKYIEIEKTEQGKNVKIAEKKIAKEETQSKIEIVSYYVGSFKSNLDVKKDKNVKKGQLLGSIESVGISHEVICPVDGILEEVYVKDKDIIEYGQKLFLISEVK
ncbi:MAG TPA: hypothetical protein PKW55_02705 [Spirochaetota bacterium]|nr:hypothetical protein [Spirochaetota bacterium]HOM38241.1 hypothetical protein [Spirochaetota bacterium]HPQ48541.1 hypothetical protein [Spirochaetota bacterium]